MLRLKVQQKFLREDIQTGESLNSTGHHLRMYHYQLLKAYLKSILQKKIHYFN